MAGILQTQRRFFTRAVVLALLVWVVYADSLHGTFHFDDFHVIPHNPSVRGGPENIPSFFLDISHFSILATNRDYRPLFLSSMALCWWLGDGSTLPFHLVSVSLHMGSVLLLFLILRLLFSKRVDPSGGLSRSNGEGAAFVASALFAVHPLASESVNYISSQAVPLAVFFYLLSFYLFLTVYSDRTALKARTGWLRRSASYLAYSLSLLSKPIAISLPLNLLLWELLLGHAPSKSETEGQIARPSHLFRLLKHLPYAIISLVYWVVRESLFSEPFGGTQPFRSSLAHYLTQTKALIFYYLKLALIPVGLNVDLDYPVSTSILEGRVIVSLLVLTGLAILLIRLRRQRVILFLSLWFLVGLLLTTYGVILHQVVNEHRVYLSLAGFCALSGLLLYKFKASLPLRISDLSIGTRSGRALHAALVVIVLATFSALTMMRNQVWSSGLTLWEDAALKGGTWRAHMNYGLALEAEGAREQALEELKKAVELGPYAFAHLNLGNAYIKRGQQDRGLFHLKTAVNLYPTSPETHLYLAYGLRKGGLIGEAEKELREALALRPNYMQAYKHLAELYEEVGNAEGALQSYQQLLELDGNQAWVRRRIERLSESRASSLVKQALERIARGEHQQALPLLLSSYKKLPDNPDVLFNLAFCYQKLGQGEQAIQLYDKLLRLLPDHLQGNFNLAYACLKGNHRADWTRSVALFEKVIEIDSSYTEALHHLASAHWKLRNVRQASRYDELYLENGSHADLKALSQSRLDSGTPVM